MAMRSYVHEHFRAEQCQAYIHSLRNGYIPDSINLAYSFFTVQAYFSL